MTGSNYPSLNLSPYLWSPQHSYYLSIEFVEFPWLKTHDIKENPTLQNSKTYQTHLLSNTEINLSRFLMSSETFS